MHCHLEENERCGGPLVKCHVILTANESAIFRHSIANLKFVYDIGSLIKETVANLFSKIGNHLLSVPYQILHHFLYNKFFICWANKTK